MRSIGRLTLASIFMCLVSSALGINAQERKYKTIAPEGAQSSTAFGINPRGDIVGTFIDRQRISHGFLLTKEGKLTVIDVDGAAGTTVRGINPRGDIVGAYSLSNDAVEFRGFLLTKEGDFFNIHYEGHSWEIPQRILPDGTILGCRHDWDLMETMRGITIRGDGQTEIEAFGSMNNGATPDLRLIVGLWFNMMDNQQQAYTIEDGVFTSFMVPGSNFTAAWDVNPDGVIVGVFRVGTTIRGFVKAGESYETIHYPGSSVTRTFGINPRGNVVGHYVLGGTTYAYVAHIVEE